MKKLIISTVLSVACAFTASAQNTTVTIHANQGKNIINKEIYGQFAEHLGSCIYGGLWVGPQSNIPNTDGYRNDVLKALIDLKVPVLRWPGGCFADEYHWMDGIGPRDKRPKMQNNNWGGTIEDNSFGTHEFLNLCEKIGAEPYISGNVGSGSVEELAKWVEYMTSDGDTPMANLRRKNGREKSWNVKYLGVGNESWGCGGNMRPEYYSDLFRRYSTYCRNYDNHKLYKIASGASDYDYYWTLGKCLEIEDVINKHSAIMDEKDPKQHIGLLVDEWGTWWDEEPGTIKGHLFQQNTMRDAFVAALSLNVFHRHSDRVRMANIAQIANVLQSMILTDTNGKGHMVLTPTYHVFRMYQPFQDATYLPLDVKCDSMKVRDNRTIPMVSASAAKTKDGNLVISLANVSLAKAQNIDIDIENAGIKNINGEILTSKNIGDYNDFNNPDVVKPVPFKDVKVKKNTLKVKIPAKSIVVLNIK